MALWAISLLVGLAAAGGYPPPPHYPPNCRQIDRWITAMGEQHLATAYCSSYLSIHPVTTTTTSSSTVSATSTVDTTKTTTKTLAGVTTTAATATVTDTATNTAVITVTTVSTSNPYATCILPPVTTTATFTLREVGWGWPTGWPWDPQVTSSLCHCLHIPTPTSTSTVVKKTTTVRTVTSVATATVTSSPKVTATATITTVSTTTSTSTATATSVVYSGSFYLLSGTLGYYAAVENTAVGASSGEGVLFNQILEDTATLFTFKGPNGGTLYDGNQAGGAFSSYVVFSSGSDVNSLGFSVTTGAVADSCVLNPKSPYSNNYLSGQSGNEWTVGEGNTEILVYIGLTA